MKKNTKFLRFSTIPEDILNLIIGYANKNGLDLKNYRNQVFVCKLWRDIAINSIRTLDLTNLIKTTIYSKCTLLAHILVDQPLIRFCNLNSLRISLVNLDPVKFYPKLISYEKRNFDEFRTYFSDVRKLNRVDINMKQICQKIDNDGTGDMYQSNNILPISSEERYCDKDEICNKISNIITAGLINLSKLERLIIDTDFVLNLEFIAKISSLKQIYVYSNSDKVKCLLNNLFFHNIESFIFDGLCNIDNPQKWSINFPKLKELSIFLGDYYKHIDLSHLESKLIAITTNLSNLQSLFIRGIPRNRPFQILSKLNKLENLNLSSCHVRPVDLLDIAKISSLKELILARLTLIRITGQIFNDDVLLFKANRPDILIKFTD